jgi:sulfatase modifying factor 1
MMFRFIYSRYLTLLLSLLLWALTLSAGAQGKKWAMLIGIEEYDRAEISHLDFAVNDVNAIARVLQQNLGYEAANVRTMTSAIKDANDANRPTNDNVIATLERLAKSVGPDDTFLFYFTGHGFNKDGQNFLASVNTNPLSVSTLKHSAIPLSELQQAMRTFKAKQILFVIDACRNDPEKGKGDSANKLTEGFSKSLVLASRSAGAAGAGVLFACSEGERAFEDPIKGQSVFTYYLLEALSGKAGNKGPLAMAEVMTYVRKQVGAWAEEHGKKQTPELLPKEASTMVLANKILNALENGRPLTSQELRIGLADTLRNPKDGTEVVWIPSGEFIMGSEDHGFQNEMPVRKVYLDGYYIYKNLVTVKQYKQFCSVTGRQMPQAPPFNPDWSHEDHPIVNVSWYDVQAYCLWAGASLPTEAQWEKAARGTDGRLYPWGNTFDGSYLQHSADTLGDAGGTAPVGSFPGGISPYGALDMAGNVWQWCSDWYGEDYYSVAPQRNPPGPANGTTRVRRGGSWYTSLGYMRDFRCVGRLSWGPDTKNSYLGFRCVIAAGSP